MKNKKTITVPLLRVGVVNLNGRQYPEKLVKDCLTELNSREVPGELCIGEQPHTEIVSLGNRSHKITNFRVIGNILIGEVYIYKNKSGKYLKKNLEKFIFRSRASGEVRGDSVISWEVYAFDAISKSDDGFGGIELSEIDLELKKIKDEVGI